MARASPAIASIRQTVVGRPRSARRLAQHPRRMHGREARGRRCAGCSSGRAAPSTGSRGRGRCRPPSRPGTRRCRVEQVQFLRQPLPARARVRRLRRLVQAVLAAALEAEVLHRVGQVTRVSRGMPSSSQRALEQLPGGAHERTAAQVLLVAGLLADEHDARVARDLRRTPSASPAPIAGTRGSRGRARAAYRRSRRGRAVGCERARACVARGACGARSAIASHARAGVAQQRGEQCGFGQVLPVLLRHLLPHHPQVQPRRIEDVRVVRAPQRFARVVGRRVGARARRRRSQRARRPSARCGTGVRIAQRMPAKRRAKNGATRSTMWCSGSNQATKASSLARHGAEAHEGVHLVQVAAHRLLQSRSARCMSASAASSTAGAARRARGARACGRAARSGAGRGGRARARRARGSRAARRHGRGAARRGGTVPLPAPRTARCASRVVQSSARGATPARSARARRARQASKSHGGSTRAVHACSVAPCGEQVGLPRRRRELRAQRAGSSSAARGWWSSSCTNGSTLRQRHAQAREVGDAQPARAGATRRMRSTLRTPRPGTRSSSSRRRGLRSTGKRSRMAQRPGQLRVDVEVEHRRRASAVRAISSTPKP